MSDFREQAADFLSDPKNIISLFVFVLISIMGGIGIFLTQDAWRERLWYLSGWLLAALTVAAVLVNAFIEYSNDSKREEVAAPALNQAVERSKAIYEQYRAIAEKHADLVKSAAPGLDLDTARKVHAVSSQDAQAASDRVTQASIATIDRSYFGYQDVVSATLIMNIVIFIVSGLVVVSFWNAGHVRQWTSSIMWSATFLLIGGSAGFLFGIPRAADGSKGKNSGQQTQANAQAVNAGTGSLGQPVSKTTNQNTSPIEQIADWLTKTIVGVGLVNLRKMPLYIDRLATYVAQSMANSKDDISALTVAVTLNAGPSFAVALIFYFGVLGFLSGYLLTQIFLQNVNK